MTMHGGKHAAMILTLADGRQAELRRVPDEGEHLVECARCGHIDLPLNGDELWHYARTGEGLLTYCTTHTMGWHDWKHLPL